MVDRTVRSAEIAEYLSRKLNGPDIEIHTAKAAHAAEPGCLVFLQNPTEEALERINETSEVLAIVTANVSERIQSSYVVVTMHGWISRRPLNAFLRAFRRGTGWQKPPLSVRT